MKTTTITFKLQKTRKLWAAVLLSLTLHHFSYSQGCVAVRHMSTCSSYGVDTMVQKNHWQFSMGYRWLRSNRHFRGPHEEADRKEKHTEVINISHAFDLSLTYFVNSQFNLSVALPVSYTDRSSLYEHDGVHRNHSQSHGIGDMRLTATYWLWSPEKHMKRNIAFGLGVKAPTGNWNVKDEFHRKNGIEVRPVDQSIQLGDGGWGAILETQGYAQLLRNTSLYFNGFYLINPRNTNGTLTYRKDSVEVGAIVSVMSVADQYMGRVGVSHKLSRDGGFYGNLGVRMEGVPVWDLIGGSDGFRRPGYVFSVEPGLSYQGGKNFFSLNVPIAVKRNRLKSVYDIRTQGRGGDAAFADFLVLINYAYRF